MLRLKEVVDKQRDELRAQAHEIVCKSRDTEAVSVRELAGVVCEGPEDLLSCHLPVGLLWRLGSLLGQMPFPWLCLRWCPWVGAQSCCCPSPSAAPGPPAAGATASLYGHERGPASQGGRGAGSAQERAGEEGRPGGCDAANPEGNEQEEQDRL